MCFEASVFWLTDNHMTDLIWTGLRSKGYFLKPLAGRFSVLHIERKPFWISSWEIQNWTKWTLNGEKRQGNRTLHLTTPNSIGIFFASPHDELWPFASSKVVFRARTLVKLSFLLLGEMGLCANICSGPVWITKPEAFPKNVDLKLTSKHGSVVLASSDLNWLFFQTLVLLILNDH